MCKFCEAIQGYKRAETILRKQDPDFHYRYSVAIVKRIFCKGSSGSMGSSTDYRYLGCGYKLNYCPECGTEIKQLPKVGK